MARTQGDLAGAERRLRAVVAQQECLHDEDGVVQVYACWPLVLLGGVSREREALREALVRMEEALRYARRFQEIRATAFALTMIAGTLAMTKRAPEAAWLFGAAEVFCDRSGLDFVHDCRIGNGTRGYRAPVAAWISRPRPTTSPWPSAGWPAAMFPSIGRRCLPLLSICHRRLALASGESAS